jgi:two-component system sensor histidine kinase/response regulator
VLIPQPDLLIVDDDPANLDVLGAVLRDQRCKVRVALSGSLGIEAARHQPPELMILDVRMPVMDGYETCTRLKADPVLADIPVIFVSALDDPLDKVKAFEVGGSDYLTKPFNAQEVQARVEHHVRLARLQRELAAQSQQMAEANLKLREVSILKANFAALLGHDLLAPLNFIGDLLKTLREERPVDNSALTEADNVFRRASRTVEDMAELYRSDAGQLAMEFTTVDPLMWVQRCALPYQLRAKAQGVEFQMAIPQKLPPIKGDPARLDSVLSNLLENAIKLTPKGGRIRLRAGTQVGEGLESGLRFLHIAVEDAGPGISAEDLPYVFDPFRQRSNVNSTKGIDLGLAVAQRVVAAHGGQILVQSRPKSGSAFTVLLPY